MQYHRSKDCTASHHSFIIFGNWKLGVSRTAAPGSFFMFGHLFLARVGPVMCSVAMTPIGRLARCTGVNESRKKSVATTYASTIPVFGSTIGIPAYRKRKLKIQRTIRLRKCWPTANRRSIRTTEAKHSAEREKETNFSGLAVRPRIRRCFLGLHGLNGV